MKSIRDACTPRAEVLKGDLEDAIFAADFGHVVEGIAPDVYKNPTEFFRNTHPAVRLKKIVATIFERLADAKEAGAAVRLSTGFGGGKTHTLIALWHLGNNISKTTLGTDLLPAAGRPKKVVVAGIDASKGFETKSLWGELGLKLGGKAGYATMKPYDDPAKVPNAQTVRAILPDAPLVILMDELVIYMATLDDQGRGALLAFLNLLISEIGARRQAVLVITDPAGQPAYHKEAAAIADATAQLEAARRLDDVFGRKVTDFDPIGNEAAQVIIRRLFDKVDKRAAETASAEYFNTYKRVATEHTEALPPDALEYARRIVDCYPFHPRLLETAQDRLGALQDFNKSRGTLRLFARILRDVMEGKNDLPLITAGDLNWQSDRIQADLLQRLNRDAFKAAVNADVVRHAGQLDTDFSTDIHRRVASALLLESLPMTPNAAMDKRELTLSTLRPTDVGHEAGEAVDRLMSVCWHSYKDDSGRKYQFRFDPNVNKLIEERAESVSPEDARAQVLTLAQKYFDGKTFSLRAYPSSPRAVSDSAELKLVLCDSEKLAQAICDCEDDSEPHAKRLRPFRNAIFGVAPTHAALTEAVDEMRRLMAAEEILEEHKKKTVLKEQVEELLPVLRKRVRIRTIRAFNRVVFQGRPSVTLPEKYLVSEDSALETVHGQTRLKEFLDDPRHKLVYQPADALDVDLLLDSIIKGATPSLDHKGAHPASAVYERALSHEKLRLMMNENPVRNAILKAVESGKLAVRLPGGEAYDKHGCVAGSKGGRVRSAKTLQTLRLDADVLLAPINAPCVKDWFTVDAKEGEKPKGNKIAPEEPEFATAVACEEAIQYAAKRPLRSLTLKAATPEAAKTLIALAQPFGAKSLSLSVTAGGQLKDGGTVNFSADDLRHNHPLKPIDVAAMLLRAMAEGASFEAQLALEFGDDGIKDAAAKLKKLHNESAEGVSLVAVFGKENE